MLNVKTKLILIFLITLFAVSAHSQAVSDSLKNKAGDSTAIKLDQYKKLYDAGIIGEDEYNKMKSQLQAAPNPAIGGRQQTKITDSTQIKLEQYKKLFEAGVMSEEEYNKLRSQLTGVVIPEGKQDIKADMIIAKTDTMPMSALKDRYKSKIIAGSVILSVGAGFLVGDIMLGTVSPKFKSTDTLYSEKVATRRGSEIALGILGGVSSIGGAVFLALGLKDKAIYRRRGKELSMNFNGKEIEFAFRF